MTGQLLEQSIGDAALIAFHTVFLWSSILLPPFEDPKVSRSYLTSENPACFPLTSRPVYRRMGLDGPGHSRPGRNRCDNHHTQGYYRRQSNSQHFFHFSHVNASFDIVNIFVRTAKADKLSI